MMRKHFAPFMLFPTTLNLALCTNFAHTCAIVRPPSLREYEKGRPVQHTNTMVTSAAAMTFSVRVTASTVTSY